MRYWSPDEIDKLGCHWNWVIGERSNGKSFGMYYKLVKHYVETGKQFAWLRRYSEDFAKNRGAQMFTNLECDGHGVNQVEELTGGEWTQIYYNSRRWYLARWDEDLKKTVHDPTPFAYGFAVAAMEHDKGTGYPNVQNIVYDEALTRGQYLDDEFGLLVNCVKTIGRDREDVKVWLLGNTVNPYCPTLIEMGILHIQDQQIGTIQIYHVGEDGGNKIAVEYCANVGKSKKVNQTMYAFDNPHVKMITEGSWEMDIYPRSPRKYRYSDVIFCFFILFMETTLQCDVVMVDELCFINIHKKTTPIQDEDSDLIYSVHWDPRPNHRRKLTSPVLPVETRIWGLFKAEKVFYQSNMVGEVVSNYLKWCKGA